MRTFAVFVVSCFYLIHGCSMANLSSPDGINTGPPSSPNLRKPRVQPLLAALPLSASTMSRQRRYVPQQDSLHLRKTQWRQSLGLSLHNTVVAIQTDDNLLQDHHSNTRSGDNLAPQLTRSEVVRDDRKPEVVSLTAEPWNYVSTAVTKDQSQLQVKTVPIAVVEPVDSIKRSTLTNQPTAIRLYSWEEYDAQIAFAVVCFVTYVVVFFSCVFALRQSNDESLRDLQ